MRNTYILLWAAFLVMACCPSCKKDPQDVDFLSCSITEKDNQFVKEDGVVSAEMFATCSFSGSIQKVTLLRSFSENLSDAVEVDAVKEGDVYRASFPVVMDTVYYYQYIAYRYSEEFGKEMEIRSEQVYSLSTHNVRLPSVTTKAVKYVSQSQALGWGTVTDDCGEVVTQKGVCWSLQTKPRLSDNFNADGGGMGDCYVKMKDLASETFYYARAYAKNRFGVSYGDVLRFKTLPEGILSVETMSPANVEAQFVTLRGRLIVSSGSVYYNAGFLYGLTPILDHCQPVISGSISHSGAGTYNRFFSTVLVVENNTKYYVRAYAVNTVTNDTVYGEMKSFTTRVSK